MHFDGTITLGPIITGVGLFISLVTSAYTYWRKYQDKNKPELIIFVDQLTAGTISKFLIIKNTGQIPAQIKGISFSEDLDQYNNTRILKSAVNAWVVPGQCLQSDFDPVYDKNVTVHIEFCSKKKPQKIYCDDFEVNFGQFKDLLWTDAKPPYSVKKQNINQIILNAALMISKRKI